MELFQVAYMSVIILTIISTLLGLLGIWIKDFWKNDTSWKLFLTCIVLDGGALILAIVTFFLGTKS